MQGVNTPTLTAMQSKVRMETPSPAYYERPRVATRRTALYAVLSLSGQKRTAASA